MDCLFCMEKRTNINLIIPSFLLALIFSAVLAFNAFAMGISISFADVNANSWYAKAAAWASENGVIKGINGKFAPNDNASREQLVTMIYRFAGSPKPADDINLGSFKDSSQVSAYAQDAMRWAVENGILRNEQRDLNPNEAIKKREALLTLQDLRYKYHYKKISQRSREFYKGLIKEKIAPENLIKRSYPEAITLYGIGYLTPPLCEIKGLVRQDVFGDIFYNFQLSGYNPKAVVKKNFLYFLAGIPYNDGFISATDPHIHTANSDEWRDHLVKTNAKKILKSWLNGKKIKIPKDYGQNYSSYPALYRFKFGVGFMQRVGFLKVDPTFEDLKIDSKVKRGEFFEFLYRMCKHIQENELGKDFRKTPPWQY